MVTHNTIEQYLILILETCHEGVAVQGAGAAEILLVGAPGLGRQRIDPAGKQAGQAKGDTFFCREAGAAVEVGVRQQCRAGQRAVDGPGS